MSLAPEVRQALVRRIDRLESSAQHDLTLVSRELTNLLEDLEAGVIPVHG